MSLRLADVGLLSDAKYSSSFASCSGVTRDLLRLCFTSDDRDEHEMAFRMTGLSRFSGTFEGDAASDWVGDKAD